MTLETKSILVPIDFLVPTISALSYTVELVANKNMNVILLHVVSSASKIPEAELKLNELIVQHENSKIEFKIRVMVGDIYKSISKCSEDFNCLLTIMGTHSAKGFRKVFGSKSISAISESKSTMLTVQSGTVFNPIEKIAVTVDEYKESVQVIKNIVDVAAIFNCELIFIAGKQNDSMLKSKVNVNLRIASNYAQTNKFEYSVQYLERSNFTENLLKYCAKEKVNLIATTFHQENFHVFSAKFVQHLFENDLSIPVLTVNGSALTKISNTSFL